jgi:hypothetical protein
LPRDYLVLTISRAYLVKPAPALSASGFGGAWLTLCVGFALHILDEATTGLLAVYTPTTSSLRSRWDWFPMPPFEFREWVLTLVVACGLLFCLTPVAARGMRGLRPLAWLYAVIMFLNSLGHTVYTILAHTVASVTFPRPVAGFYSTPLLFVASLGLMARLRRTSRVDYQLPSGY